MKTIIISIILSVITSILCILYVFNCGDVLLGNAWLDRDREEYIGKLWKEVDQELHGKGFYYMGYSLSPHTEETKEYRHLYCKESVLNTKKYLILCIPAEGQQESKNVRSALYLFQCPSYGLEVRGYTPHPNSDRFSKPRGFIKQFKRAIPPFGNIYERDVDPNLWLDQ
ncbi:MAG: hypothetical protein ACLSCR_08920 [Akkermansia sp.]